MTFGGVELTGDVSGACGESAFGIAGSAFEPEEACCHGSAMKSYNTIIDYVQLNDLSKGILHTYAHGEYVKACK